MAVFNNISDTAATVNPGFSFSDHADEIDAAVDSLLDATDTIQFTDPVIGPIIGPTSLQAIWADGTEFNAGITSIGTTSITLNSFEIVAPDSARFAADGTARISIDAAGDITAANFKLTRLMFGNDQATQIINGSVRLNLGTGAESGKVNALTFAFFADDPATPALEWQYVMLRGSVSVTDDVVLADLGTLSGKVTSVEFGTLTAAADGTPLSFAPASTISGFRLDAADVIDTLEADGFAGLSAGLFAGNDKIDGTAGDDFLEASTGNDKVFGEEGNDHIDGGAGNDQLFGGAGDDHIIGGAGNDKIVAGDGANDIESDGGNDNVIAGSGDDFILAGDGNDKVTAGDGNNWVEGGAGNDVLRTGAGNDVIIGGAGGDKLNGGAGDDVFVFDNLASGGKDLVNDFNVADDFLAFDMEVFTALAGGITADNLVIGKTALDTNDFLVFDTQGGKLYYDADGSGGQSAVQIAIVKGSVTGLASSNFVDADSLLV